MTQLLFTATAFELICVPFMTVGMNKEKYFKRNWRALPEIKNKDISCLRYHAKDL
jgi:hypothetical protein